MAVHLKHLAVIALLFITIACTDNKEAEDKEEKPKAILIDVRSKKEFDSGAAEGAIHIPHKQIVKEIKKHSKNKNQEILLY